MNWIGKIELAENTELEMAAKIHHWAATAYAQEKLADSSCNHLGSNAAGCSWQTD